MIFSCGITDEREGALAVDVLVADEEGYQMWVPSSGLTVDEAIERAEVEVSARFGYEWTYQDWRAA